MCWTLFKKFGILSEHFSPPVVSQAGYGPGGDSTDGVAALQIVRNCTENDAAVVVVIFCWWIKVNWSNSNRFIVYRKESFPSKEPDTNILYLAYKVAIISSAKCMR